MLHNVFFFFMENSIKKKNTYCLFYAWERIIKSLSFVKLILSYLLIYYFFLWSNMFFCPLTDDNEDATVNKIA